MTVTMDPRLEDRRRQVREDSARMSTRRILWLLAALALVAGALWVIQSPLLAVREIVVRGVEATDLGPILEAEQVVEGTALLTLRSGDIEEAILANPWIAEARVDILFPDSVEIEVIERRPGAWLQGPQGATLLSVDGVMLEHRSVAPIDADIIHLATIQAALGAVHPDPRVTGAVEFLASLNDAVPRPVSITERDGDLWAALPDLEVRLGRPVAMVAKAASLIATLEVGVQPGSTIVLLAPSRPAVVVPTPLVDGEVQPAESPPGLQPKEEP